MTNEVLPAIERLEQKDWALARQLVRRAGELGLLGTDVPESFGGVGLDKVASIIVGEAVGRSASFATTFGAQTGLAITPLLCFGTEQQKAKYLPGWSAARSSARTRSASPGSGSDALGAKARATRHAGRQLHPQRREDVDHQRRLRRSLHRLCQGATARQFTAFLVERAFPGRQQRQGRAQDGPARLVDDAADPAGCAGAGGERARGDRQGAQGRVQRAELRPLQARGDVQRRRRARSSPRRRSTPLQRKQFGQPIAAFGAIKHKLAEMAIAAVRRREHAVSHRRAHRQALEPARRTRRAARPCSPRSRSSRSKRRSSRSPAAR